MKLLAVRLLSVLLDAWYAACSLGGRKQQALFLSRQSDDMSVDFTLLAEALQRRGDWDIVARTKMVEDGSAGAVALVARMFGDVRALAKCRMCFVEGYNPAVSLLHLQGDAAPASPGVVNNRFPAQPVVMQVWHAAGHFKKFGYEALDTPEGRSSRDAEIFRMHRNYSWVACSGEGAREGFAQAFACPVERVVALGHPSFDELYEPAPDACERMHRAYPGIDDAKPIVVFAPTLHRQEGNRRFEELKAAIEADPRANGYNLLWSFHPVSLQGSEIRVTTRELLRSASLVVTDYSSVVYDAAILGVPFAFYTPDIDEYRISPGLATDPGTLAPGLCLDSPDALLDFLDRVFADGVEARGYPDAERDAFVGTTLSACGPGSAERIVDFTLAHLQ
ncbi:MAG: CDP-glycerol glycerophosphotransferase family protein [Coriobacteriaceae bacterium]|nr:CDP-glycerol glycerophosphotransferase family protein [Coriobacteriaceae bacterium]